jgi:hypothetical protein
VPRALAGARSLAREAVIRNGSFDFRRRNGYFPCREKQPAADKDKQSGDDNNGCEFFHAGATLSRFVIRRQSQSPTHDLPGLAIQLATRTIFRRIFRR